MGNFPAIFLIFAISAGQLIKIPLPLGGVTFLDASILLLSLIGLHQLKFKLKTPPNYLKLGLSFAAIGLFSLAITPLNLNLNEYILSSFYGLRFFCYLFLGWVIYSGGLISLPDRLLKVLILSAVTLSVFGIFQFLFLPDLRFLESFGWDPHYFRAVSTFFDPNFLGAFLTIPLILIFQDNAKATRWNIIIASLIYITILLTFSRSSYLMFFVSLSALAYLKKSIKIFALSVFLSAGLLLGFQIYTQSVSQPKNIDRAKSAVSRFNTWQQGANIFQKSPLMGIGFNSYRFALREYNLAGDDFLTSHGSTSNDSSLLFVLATTGLLGIIVYLCFLFSLAKSSPILSATVLGLLAHSVFNNSLFYPPILLTLFILPILKFSIK